MSKNDNVRPIDRVKEAVSEKVDQTREAVNDGIGTAREKIQDVAADVGDRLRDVSATTSDKVRGRTEQARVVAREKYEATADQLRDGYGQLQKSVDDLADDIGDFVRDNPGKAVLLAAAAGLLVGLIFRRRSDA